MKIRVFCFTVIPVTFVYTVLYYVLIVLHKKVDTGMLLNHSSKQDVKYCDYVE